jgi:hypothetical protein
MSPHNQKAKKLFFVGNHDHPNFFWDNVMKLISDFKIRTINRRLYKNRRKYTYTEHIPERRSGKDRRKSKNGKSAFWPSTSPEHKNSKV